MHFHGAVCFYFLQAPCDDSVLPSITVAAPQAQLNDKKVDFEVMEPVDGKLMEEDVSVSQKNLSPQDKFSEAYEKEAQPINQEDSSLQEEKDVISEMDKNEMQPANQKLSPEQEKSSESETEVENKENLSLREDACISETTENMIQSAAQENSLMQEEKNACILEVNEGETEFENQEHLPLQEEIDANISKSDKCTIQAAEQEKSPKQDQNADVSQTNGCKLELESDINVHENLADLIAEDLNHDKNTEAENNSESMCNQEKINEDICVKHEENAEGCSERAKDNCLSPHGGHTSSLEMQDKENANPKPKRSRRAATTPAKHLRRSVACCFDGTVTPTLSRLRPRTPCSRSTRRSLSAHCDSPWEMFTPSRRCSVKKTPRCSVSKEAKLTGLQESHNASLMASEITATTNLHHDTKAVVVNVPEKPAPLPDLHKMATVDELKKSSSPLMTPGESVIPFFLLFTWFVV